MDDLETLIKIAKTELDDNLRERAIRTLLTLRQEQVWLTLNRVALREFWYYTREKVIKYLGTPPDEKLAALEDSPAIEQHIERLLHDEDQSNRWQAVKASLLIGGLYAVEPLIQTANNDVYAPIRGFAVTALGILRQKAIIYKINHDKSAQVRRAAFEAAYELKDKEAIPYLVWAFHYDHGDPDARLSSLSNDSPKEYITKHLTRRAIEAICLQNNIEPINPEQALDLVSDELHLELLLYGLEYFEKQGRYFLAQTFGKLEDKRIIEALIRAVHYETKLEERGRDPYVLLALASTEQLEAIAVLAQQVTEFWGQSAVGCLAKFGIKAMPTLIDLLHNSDPLVRSEIIRRLSKFKSPAIVKPLAQLVQTENDIYTKETAIRALAQLGELAIGALPALITIQQTDLTDVPLVIRRIIDASSWTEGTPPARYLRNAAHSAIKSILEPSIHYDSHKNPSQEEVSQVVVEARSRLQSQLPKTDF